MASLMYAYEDIFGNTGSVANQPVGAGGPHGTAVMGNNPVKPVTSESGWKPATVIGLGAAVLVILTIVAIAFANLAQRRERRMHERAEAAQKASDAAEAARFSFGPVMEQVIQARPTGTNQFLDLDNARLATPSPEISAAMADSGGREDRFWSALDIAPDTERFGYIAWLRESGTDLMFAGGDKSILFDAVVAPAHGDSSANWNNWEGISAERVSQALDVVDWSQRANEAHGMGHPTPPAPETGGIVNSATQLESQFSGGPRVSLLTREQSALWFFKTREGKKGLLEIVEFTENPSAMKVRYKLVRSGGAEQNQLEDLTTRLEAATGITGNTERDAALAKVAQDAARAGEVEIVRDTLQSIVGSETRDQAALASARSLAQVGLKKPAVEIAKSITGSTLRDLALAELAR